MLLNTIWLQPETVFSHLSGDKMLFPSKIIMLLLKKKKKNSPGAKLMHIYLSVHHPKNIELATLTHKEISHDKNWK